MLTIKSTQIKINPIPVHYKIIAFLHLKYSKRIIIAQIKINGLGKNKH